MLSHRTPGSPATRRAVASVALLLVLGACSSPPPGTTQEAREKDPVPAASASPDDRPSEEAPRTVARIPTTAAAFAEHLAQVEKRLRRQVRRWRSSGEGTRSESFRELQLTGLEAQKLYRRLAKWDGLAARVPRHLPAPLAWKVRANMRAASALSSLVTPLKPPIDLPTKRPQAPTRLMRHYRAAAERFGIPWYVLASLNFVESKFGRLNGPSSAGALGPMQFMPATWDAYGNGGDVWDPRDAIMGAARYLRASGAPERMADALYAYNHSWDYVEAIQVYARQMRADEMNFYGYYLYQVFVLTTEGPMQITGPGKDT